MIQDYSEGGVKMVDIRSYFSALKCTWIRRLLRAEDSGWSSLFYTLFNFQNILFLEGGHPSFAQFLQRAIHPNRFWLDVLTAWGSYVQCHQPTNQIDSLTSVLWYNHRIRINYNCVHYKHWINKGVFYVCDLLDERGFFLTMVDFMAKFGVTTNFLEYGGIIKAVKQSFGTAMMDKDGVNICFPFIPFNFRLLLQDKKGSNRIYNCLTSAKKVAYKFIAKWETKLSIQLTKPKWMVLCNIPFCVTNDTRLRWFQYRLVHSQLILSQNR